MQLVICFQSTNLIELKCTIYKITLRYSIYYENYISLETRKKYHHKLFPNKIYYPHINENRNILLHKLSAVKKWIQTSGIIKQWILLKLSTYPEIKWFVPLFQKLCFTELKLEKFMSWWITSKQDKEKNSVEKLRNTKNTPMSSN